MAAPSNPQVYEVLRQPGVDVQVELSWDYFGGKSVDLDASALLFDSWGTLVDAAFYNQLECFHGAVRHHGDSKKGDQEGPDEVITVDLDALDPNTISFVVFVVNAHNAGATLSDVETASYKVTGVAQEVSLGAVGSSTGIVLCALQRNPTDPTRWTMIRIDSPCSGNTFDQSASDIRTIIGRFGLVDPILLAEGGRNLAFGKHFDMAKGDCLTIPADLFKGGEDLFVGLGWDAQGSVDLDASVVLFDAKNHGVDRVYFGNKTNKNSSIQHMGDNMSGAGAGDDEVIKFDLDTIPDDVQTAYVTVNVFSSSQTFASVSNAYMRVVAIKNNEELARFKIDKGITTQGVVFCSLSRAPCASGVSKSWQLRSLSTGIEGRTASFEAIEKIFDPAYEKKQLAEKARIAAEKAQLERDRARANQSYRCTLLIKEARGLAAMDRNGKSDPYIKLSGSYILVEGKEKTSIQKKTLTPVWNETVVLQGTTLTRVSLQMFDHDKFSKDDYMARYEFSFGDYIKNAPTGDDVVITSFDGWAPLKLGQGEIHLSITLAKA